VREALARLPEAQREVLVLCEMEGRTDEEAAALLGIPSGTAKSRLRLARARFQVVAQRMGLDEEVGDDA
jgi:RNA polymerase sigma-70 factor (ECF subfamily)